MSYSKQLCNRAFCEAIVVSNNKKRSRYTTPVRTGNLRLIPTMFKILISAIITERRKNHRRIRQSRALKPIRQVVCCTVKILKYQVASVTNSVQNEYNRAESRPKTKKKKTRCKLEITVTVFPIEHWENQKFNSLRTIPLGLLKHGLLVDDPLGYFY